MKLYTVGFGSGDRDCITKEAERCIVESDVVMGYRTYIDILRKIYPDKNYIYSEMRQERQRVQGAIEIARSGKTVSIVCSGDSEVYGMASLAIELSAGFPEIEVKTVAGVTSALSCGAVLGSPLTNDFAVISLSDLLTPYETIEKRLRGVSLADMVTVIYNPSSAGRPYHLEKACKIILEYKPPETVCGYVKNAGREGQFSKILTLGELVHEKVDMFTTVFVGNSQTKIIAEKMVTLRGYGKK